MEKRWCERIPVSTNVVIHHNGHKLGKCTVKNISLCGICLNSGPLAFYEGTKLQIKFLDTGYLPGSIDTTTAIVVRNSHHEIGLAFNPTEPELLQSIIKYNRTHVQQSFASARS